MKKILISPPFSNILPSTKAFDLIIGTYTLKRRKGLHRVITTLKKTKSGWLNSVGLRNPGIRNLKKKNSIVSVSLRHISDWEFFKKVLINKSKKLNILGIEFNVSCPNLQTYNVNNEVVKEAKDIFKTVILKLPHDCSEKELDFYVSLEADYLHVSNAQKTKKGALSGTSLVEKNINSIKYIKENYRQRVIAGGGIYNFNHFLLYKEAGADAFSLSTSLLRPIKSYKLIKKMSQYLK